MQRQTIFKLGLVALALLGVSSLRSAGVSAASAPVGGERAGETRAQTAPANAPGTYSGKVIKNTNSGLTLHGNDGDRTVVVQPGATITRDGKSVAVSDLKTDDQVTLTVDQTGIVRTIDATSKKSSGFNPAWLLLLLLLIPVLLLLWLLSRRKKSDFVVERNTATTTPNRADDFTVEKNQSPRGTPPRA